MAHRQPKPPSTAFHKTGQISENQQPEWAIFQTLKKGARGDLTASGEEGLWGASGESKRKCPAKEHHKLSNTCVAPL